MQQLIVYDHDDLGTQLEYYSTLEESLLRYNELLELVHITRIEIYEIKTIAAFDRTKVLPYADHTVVYNIIN